MRLGARYSLARVFRDQGLFSHFLGDEQCTEGMSAEMAEQLCSDLGKVSGEQILEMHQLTRLILTAECSNNDSESSQLIKWSAYDSTEIASWLRCDSDLVENVKV